MKEKDKNSIPEADGNDEKLDISKSIFQVNKELKKQREEELEKQQLEIERQYAEREKKKREEYEKKLLDEKIELMRLKQGITTESEVIHEEEKPEEQKLPFTKKITNFLYHNKWWLGMGLFFSALGIFLVQDILSKPNPDMSLLLLCDNEAIGNSAYLESYFSGFGEDFNKNGEVLVSVYYIPYSDDEYRNFQSGATTKLTTFLNNADSVIIIGNKRTSEDLLPPEESFVDLSELYPDNVHVRDYFFYLSDTDFAEKLGVPEEAVTDDMYLALRKPKSTINSSLEDMQETYDRDFPVFDRIIRALSEE